MKNKIIHILIGAMLLFSVSGFINTEVESGENHCLLTESVDVPKACCHEVKHAAGEETSKSCDVPSKDCCSDHCCCLKLNLTVEDSRSVEFEINTTIEKTYFVRYQFVAQEFYSQIFRPPVA